MKTPPYYVSEAFLRHPKYPGKTYTELKAERAIRWRHIKQGGLVLAGVALAVAMWVLR